MRSSLLSAGLVVAAVALLAGGFALSGGTASSNDELGRLALALAALVTVALIGGHFAVRAGQPAVLGELLAGVLLGGLPGLHALQFIGSDPYVDILARIGMLLLLFEVGLELRVGDLFGVGPSALLVALLGTVGSLAVGTLTAAWFMPDAPRAAQVFLGGGITATSVGISARVLRDVHASRGDAAKIILGAAVVDDVLALIVLGVLTVWATVGVSAIAGESRAIAALVMKTVGFLVLALILGAKLTPASFRRAARLRTRDALLAVGLRFCFFLAWAASAIGLAPLVGAFAAGLVLEDSHSESFVVRGERSLPELLEPMTSFLVPLFFVLVGFRMNVAVFARPAFLTLALALAAAAVIGKMVCGAGVRTRGASRASVAIGMLPRGEVTLVFAALGSSIRIGQTPLLDERGYAALVAVVILTTLVTPPALKWSLGRQGGARFTPPGA